ncbi:MAG: alpha/beta fold hydrolase [Altererythrobacter sp.]
MTSLCKLAAGISLAFLLLTTGLHAREAGEILVRQDIADAPSGMNAWRVRYVTGGRKGVPEQEATGVILAPLDRMAGPPRGIVAWTHGTWGVASKCAPSQSEKFFDLTPAIDAVRMGYVVVAPDYPGLGTDTVHPYLVGQPAAQSVLDIVRAARTLPDLRAGSQFVVWGESQGGHAALWTGMTAADAGDLELLGVAAGAPPTDLAANFRQASDANARAFLTALAADSWSRYYKLDLNVGKRRTPPIIRKLASNCIASGSMPRLGALLGMLTLRSDLKRYDFAAEAPWADIIRDNSAQPTLTVPLLIAQTGKDPLVAPAVTRNFASKACSRGLPVRWIDLPGKDHATTAKQSAAETLQWITDRFAGKAPPSDCGQLR